MAKSNKCLEKKPTTTRKSVGSSRATQSLAGNPWGQPAPKASARKRQDAAQLKPDSVENTPGKPGRASTFSTAIADEIVTRLGNGEPLRQICRDEHMPAWRTVYDWQEADKAFAARIAHARELGEEAIAQECLGIADDATNDWMETHGKDGAELYKINGEHIQRSKLRIEVRLKLLAKWNPRKWGEKVDLNHGVQPENPLASMLQRIAGTGLPVIAEEQKK